MRVLMGIIKGPNGVYYARKKVPSRLVEAVGKSWLKKTLNTKDAKRANILAKPVLIEFDKQLARAEVKACSEPIRTSLTDAEIAQIADYHYALMLAEDDEVVLRAKQDEALYRSVGEQIATPCSTEAPKYGLSERQQSNRAQTTLLGIDLAEAALARGDISHVLEPLEDLLGIFHLTLDREGESFLKLGLAVLRAHIAALHDVAGRQLGEPIPTPPIIEPHSAEEARVQEGGSAPTLKAAFEGWQKAKVRTLSTIKEFEYAIRLFSELHGALPLTAITRAHVRQYREALQMIPRRRVGVLRQAPLPRLVEWAKGHPEEPRINPKTANKLIASVGALAVWAYDNGMIPDDTPWSNPFARMLLDDEAPTREPWDIAELRLLFDSPVYTHQQRPKAGCGEAAYWLPLLGIFTGARLGELASLARSDVITDDETGIVYLRIAEDEARGRRVKTASSRRVVPVHPELVRLGFLSKVVEQEEGQLFPLIKPGFKDGYGEAWSKWFGRHIRSIGITNRASVFHSFRHGFKDALRAAGISEDVNDALTGHAGAGGVGRKYGAKEMMRRFGLKRLPEAIALVEYPGLDLRHLG